MNRRGDEGVFAIITAGLTAANMNEWQKHIEARRSSAHPKMKMVALRPCDDLKDKAGRLREMQIEGDDILMGKSFIFTKENVDQFNF